MGRTKAVRGPGRRRSRQLSVVSFAASQIYAAARGSRSLALGAVSDHKGKLLSQGDPRSHRPDFCEAAAALVRSEEHTSELQSHLNLVCRLLLEKKKKK